MNKLMESLHPLERKILPILINGISLKEIVKKSKLKDVEAMRALQWLENKEIIKLKKDVKEIVDLDKNGKEYLKEGLPEKKFLKVLDKELSFDEIKDKANLNDQEFNISLGLLRKKGVIELNKNKVKQTKLSKNFLEKESLEELFLKKLPLEVKKLSDEERYAYNELKKRKEIIKLDLVKDVTITLTKEGIDLKKVKIEGDYIERVDANLLKTGSWKGKKFRRYDIKINVPKIYPGKRHFVNEALEHTKKIWLDMGFKEMTGNLLQTSFWNFDALFTAQDHPVRDLQDTYYIKEPKYGKITNKTVMERVRRTHENGWTTKSKGWQYDWDLKEAMKNVLRTHTTVLSAKTIAALKESDLPAKFFAVGRCFRNETVDWKHSFEFMQSEGIVIGKDVNFKQLLGYLKEFFKKMGFDQIRVRPGFFAFTEPSLEIDVFHPGKKEWIEMAGAGILRPEVVKPLLGKDIPVLAWGIGLDRTIMDNLNIKDIRDLHKNDLKQLKEMKCPQLV
ncbi:MAG: phenylalanine--tRNA ligase subunit alpha [Nanoarchaeota archaeon]|nr:phenylalanine--tRNA ligase subunit alpha [Nanoarchaeota archaeon]